MKIRISKHGYPLTTKLTYLIIKHQNYVVKIHITFMPTL